MSTLIERLGDHGARYRDPVATIRWHEADPAAPWLPPHLLSLAGLPVQQRMSRAQTLRLSQLEFARLCAAGLWLEGLLISRITADGFPAARAAEARVMLQEVREESGHGLMFLEMIRRAGLEDLPLLGPTRLLNAVARRLRTQDAEFWAMVLIGESVTDALALRALREARGENTLCPVARQVLALHHRDEARHIAAARAFIDARAARMGRLRRARFGLAVRWLLRHFLRATLYPTRESLAALGVDDPGAVLRAALACPRRRELANALAAHPLSVLRRGPMALAAGVPP
jgi:hypothetical protein